MNPETDDARNAAGRVVDVLARAGHTAYFAGGCVRDILRGVRPVDYDVATDAPPGKVVRLFPRTVQVGAHFGVVVVIDGGITIEVATFRADGIYIDGRHPVEVRFSTPAKDAARRDFTINGMFLDPRSNKIIDFVGGRADLEERVVRAIGDPNQRFEEDKLRVLRAVRFGALPGFHIDPGTWTGMLQHASGIHLVSPERIRGELGKILGAPQRVAGFDLLDASGLLCGILPEVAAMKDCQQPPEFHPEGDVFVHTRIMLGLLAPDAPVELVCGVLFHDIGKPSTSAVDATGRIRFNGHERVGAQMTASLMRRLRFSNDEIEAVVSLVANHMAFKDVQQMRVAKLRRFMARPGFHYELELHRVDCASSHGMLDNHEFLLRKAAEFADEPLIPPRLVSGRDLIAIGLQPGPRFKEILDEAQTLQLEGSLASREDALQWLGNFQTPETPLQS